MYIKDKNEIIYSTYNERESRMYDHFNDEDASYMSPDVKIVPSKTEKRFVKREFGMDYNQLTKQTLYDDCNARMEAFMEVFNYMVTSDEEDWRSKGDQVFSALKHKNTEYLLASLCGYGAHSLAKMAMLVRDEDYEFHDEVTGKIVVYWENGKTATSACRIDVATLGVWCYNPDILMNPWDDARIRRVTVLVNPLGDGMEHEFKCVSMDTMRMSQNDGLYWFTPDPDVEPELYLDVEADEDEKAYEE